MMPDEERMIVTRWEYTTLDDGPSLADLNAAGADGWELVGSLPLMAPDHDTDDPDHNEVERLVLVFKRPRALGFDA